MASESYEVTRLKRQEQALDEILDDMPPCIQSIFMEIRLDCRPGTVLDYARDTHEFLLYLTKANPTLKGKKPKDISVDTLSALTADDVNEFFSSCRTYRTPKGMVRETGKLRLAGIRSSLSVVFNKLYTKEIITRNPVASAARFHIPAKKTIDVLEKKEAKKLLHAVENTELDSPNAAARSKRTVLRDTAIVTLLLNIRTGSHSPSELLHQVELEVHPIPPERDHFLFCGILRRAPNLNTISYFPCRTDAFMLY